MRRVIIDSFTALVLFAGAAFAQVGSANPVIPGGGSGGGVTGLTACTDGTALADNAVMRGDSTDKCQGSTVTMADAGDLQWEGVTANDFEGNFTFVDPTADWTWAWGATGIMTTTASVRVGDGTKAAPAYSFAADTDTGLYERSVDRLTVSIGANAEFEFQTTGFLVNSDNIIGFAGSGAVDADGAASWIEQPTASLAVIQIHNALKLPALAAPLRACDATAAGDIYLDTSLALCFCDGTTFQVLNPLTVGVGTCS